MKITRLYFKHLRNEAHFRFFATFIALFTDFPAVGQKIAVLLESLRAIFEREDVAVDLLRKSDYTAKIAAADHRLDKAVSGFGNSIHNAIHHFNPDVADASLSLGNLLGSYGKIAKKTYNEELAAVINLLQDLETPAYMSKVALISGLDEWITEMKTASDEVSAQLNSRTIETAGRPHERMVNIRREIEPVYHAIITRIEALALLEGEAEYSAFVAKLNALVDEFNKIHTHTHKKAGKETTGE